MPVKGHDNGNNLHDVYTTNEVLSILQQAIDNGSMQGIDPSLNPIIDVVRESHANNNLTFWQGTEAEFNALGISGEILGAKIDENGKIYVLTGDTTLSDAVANAAAAAQEVLANKVDIPIFDSLKNGLQTQFNGTLLYSNSQGTQGTITLPTSVNNFDYLLITGTAYTYFYEFRVPVSKQYQSYWINVDNSHGTGSNDSDYTNRRIFKVNININGTVIEQSLHFESIIEGWGLSNLTVRVTHTNPVYITKIVGFGSYYPSNY